MSDQVRAAAFAEALHRRLVSPAEVIAWVDERIADSDGPHDALLSASLAKRDVSALISALHRFAGSVDRRDLTRALLSDMSQALDRDATLAKPIASALYSMATAREAPSPEAESRMLYFDDALDDARSGTFGTETEVVEELRSFLSQYREAAA